MHSPGVRCPCKPKTGPVAGNPAAVWGQAASRSIPRTEGSDSPMESRQLRRFKVLPHSCLCGLPAGGCPWAEVTEWDGCPGLSCPSSGPMGCTERADGELGQLQHGHRCPRHELGRLLWHRGKAWGREHHGLAQQNRLELICWDPQQTGFFSASPLLHGISFSGFAHFCLSPCPAALAGALASPASHLSARCMHRRKAPAWVATPQAQALGSQSYSQP